MWQFIDTLVALMAGLVIFPACFAFGVNPGSGPNLVFITLPNVFNGNARKQDLGSDVLLIYELCGTINDHCSISEHPVICTRPMGMEP